MLQFHVSKGYTNWKDAIAAFKSHEKSACHREAVEMIITLPGTTTHIGVLLSRQHAIEMERNRRMLLKVLACINFLAQQGLPLRGHDDDSDSNLIQLLKHHGEEDKELLQWLHKKSNKYTSHEIQNELIRYSHFINFFLNKESL